MVKTKKPLNPFSEKTVMMFHKGSQYYEYKNLFDETPLPEYVKSRVGELTDYAVDRGVLKYTARVSALKYTLEHEYPEYLLLINIPELPVRGYSKCLRIWSELGVVHNTSRREALMKVVNSREFEDKLLSEGVPTNLLNIARQRTMKIIERDEVPKGSLLKSVKSLINIALEIGGESYV